MYHMSLWVTAILLVANLQWIHINAMSVSEKACLNSTGLLGEKCFSIHFDLEFSYNDAEKHCQQNHSGTVWSMTNEEEIIYLKKLHARNKSWYWVGAYRYGDSWVQLSDNSSIPANLIKSHKKEKCLAIRLADDKLTTMPCKYNSYSICNYIADMCEYRKQGNECYHISYKEESMANATETCENLGHGGKLVEIQSEEELQFYKTAIQNSKAFEHMSNKKLKQILKLPTVWKLKNSSSVDHNSCEIFQDSQVKKYNCDQGSYGFACEYQAQGLATLPEKLVTQIVNSTQNDSVSVLETSTVILLEETENAHENETNNMETTTSPEKIENTQTKSEHVQKTSIADETKLSHHQYPTNEQTPSFTIHYEIPTNVPMTSSPKQRETSLITQSTDSDNEFKNSAPQDVRNASSGETTTATANEQSVENGNSMIPAIYIYMPITTIFTVIGIIVIIILLIKLLKKNGNGNGESSYLEPITPQNTDPAGRMLPSTPTGTNIPDWGYAVLNSEYEPLQHHYTYID